MDEIEELEKMVIKNESDVVISILFSFSPFFLLTFMSSCGSYLSLLFFSKFTLLFTLFILILSPFTSLLSFVFCVLHGVLSLLFAS